MKLKAFFDKLAQENIFDTARIVNVIVPAQPILLFSSFFLAWLKNRAQLQLIQCDICVQSVPEIQSQLATSFLGSSFLYALQLTDTIGKQEAELLSFLESYDGVHKIVLFTQHAHALREREDIVHLFLEDTIDYTTYMHLATHMKKTRSEERATQEQQRYAAELFQRSTNISLDTACMMMHYQQVLGRNSQQFFVEWFDRIIEQKQSLFLLSQYLFARDAYQFYSAWEKLSGEYPPEFWVAYWSEQLWQAMIFLSVAQTDGVQAAKKATSRLPFSFMQKDWQKHSQEKLITLHDHLYQIDYANKNGAITPGLDAWCAKFLLS